MYTLAPPPLVTPSSPPPIPVNIPCTSSDPTELNSCCRLDPMENEHLLDDPDVSFDDLPTANDSRNSDVADVIDPPPAGEARTAALSQDEPAPASEQDVVVGGEDHINKSAIDETNFDEIKARTSKYQFDKGNRSSGNPVKPLKNIKNQPLYLSTWSEMCLWSKQLG